MESVIDRVTKATKSDINKVRWALGVSGALSIAFAVVILIWPDISLYALVLLFGAYSLATGVIMLGTAIGGRVKEAAAGSRLRALRALP
jgi:uncharacterized membrane protein HdeD (DUF308 family)